MKPDRNSYLNTSLPGGFQIRRFIGQGAFAWVYEARLADNSPVAVKVQHNLNDDSYKRFIREIKVLRELPENANCVRYAGDGETPDGLPFLAMEFVDGKNLKQILKKRPLWPEREACEIMVQLCDAFAGIHQLGLVHRDVKPENVMLSRDMEVKLMDFGLIKDAQGLLKLFEDEDILEGRDFAENIDRGVLAGTPEYMAPEQFSDPSLDDSTKEQTDTWTDVYSLGLIFYELLTGKKLFPFRPTAKDRAGHAKALVAYLHERTQFDDREIVRPELASYELWTIIERALKQSPKLRQRNATDLGAQIRHYVETGEGIVVEDEDKTSAIKIDAFMARYGKEILKRQMAADSAAEGLSSTPQDPLTATSGVEDDGGHTVPLTRERLDVITSRAGQGPRPDAVEEARTTRWTREEAAAMIGMDSADVRAVILGEGRDRKKEVTHASLTPVQQQTPATQAPMPTWVWVAIGGGVGLLILVVIILLIG